MVALLPILPTDADLARLRGQRIDDLRFKVVDEPDSWLHASYDFLRIHFAEDVLDPIDSFIEWIEMNRRNAHPFPFLLIAAYFQEGDRALVVGVISGNVMRLEHSEGAHIFAIGNLLTAPVVRRAGLRGVGSRLLEYSFVEAKADAQKQGGCLSYGFLEAEDDSVGFWQKMGFLWPRGVTYWQPPLEFDENGDFLHLEVPEIAMLKPLEVKEKHTIDRALLHDLIATVYLNWALSKYRTLLSPEAMHRAESYVMGDLLGRVDQLMPREAKIELVQRPTVSQAPAS